LAFVDTHTHLYLEQFDEDRDQAVDRAIRAGVNRLLLPNVDSETIPAMMQVSQTFPGTCLPMMGLHPTSVKPGFEAELEVVTDWLARKPFVAVGETGLDLYWDKTHLNEQIAALKVQVELALKYDIPLVLHSRKSLNELFSVLKAYKGSRLKGVFHCFPGNVPDAEKAIELGFLLGIGGVITYKNSTMAKVVGAIGLDHILLETDAPYLPPVPYRGKRNESAYIPVIAEKVAEATGESIERVEEATTANAIKLFNLK
jgi:TatD DNase family protein